MPAEWEKHAATWIAWPHRKDEWIGKFDAISMVYAEIVRGIITGERACILAKAEAHKRQILDILKSVSVDTGRVDIYVVATDRIWARDYGPIFVQDGKKQLMLDFRFNGWAKWPDHKKDDKVPGILSQALKLPVVQPVHKGRRVVLEGGSIDVNGKGTLITTEECLQSKVQERNPGFTKKDYEEVFADYLGITHTIWLGSGIAGDDTHGHVDDITRFVNATTVVTAVEQDRKSPNYKHLADNLKRLKKARDQRGRQLDIVELPMPKIVKFEGGMLPASYANFLITNKTVLVPTFADASDRIALNILAGIFTDREVIGIHARDLVQELGTIHCLSQQQPL